MWGFHIMDWNERDNIDNLFFESFFYSRTGKLNYGRDTFL